MFTMDHQVDLVRSKAYPSTKYAHRKCQLFEKSGFARTYFFINKSG